MLLEVIVDFLHQLATVAWIGGMIYTMMVLMPSLPAIEIPERGKLAGAVTKRFTIVAWTSVVVLIITGIILGSFEEASEMSDNVPIALKIKHILFLLMIIIGLVMTFILGPKMKKLAPKPGEKPSPEFPKVQKRISSLALINMILGILVLLANAMM